MKYSAKDIEAIIIPYLAKEEGYPVRVIEAMNYAFLAGGKRLRPMLMRLCYDLYREDYQAKRIEPFMAAIEMIHTYSLIHDDLPALDNDSLRRGKPTVHVAYGEDIAVLAGDGLLNYAYETAAGAFTSFPGDAAVERAFQLLAKKAGIYGMVGGQTLDVILSGKDIKEDELQYIYENKTSALIEAPMMIGAILGGAGEEDIEALMLAAREIGMAFQVQDDILDIVGDEAEIGKPVNSDEKNLKNTYATIHGLEAAKQFVEETSFHAMERISKLQARDEEAKKELLELVQSLIGRNK